MNVKFVVRGLLLALPVAVAAAVGGLVLTRLYARIGPPPDPTPPRPTITAPLGPLPPDRTSFQLLALYDGQSYGSVVGCGFLLRSEQGQIVGSTAAHSVSVGDPSRLLEKMAFRSADQATLLEFNILHGLPGRPRSGLNMTVDYILLQPKIGVIEDIGSDLVLAPDPRGGPQAGERVTLFKCVGQEDDQRQLQGTVQSASDTAVWVLMDRHLAPDVMSGSGSPFVSQHTGQVVGMLIAGTIRRDRVLMGVHPVGSLIHLIDQAEQFPGIEEYRLPTPQP